MEEVLDGFKVTVGNARSWIRCKEEILDRQLRCMVQLLTRGNLVSRVVVVSRFRVCNRIGPVRHGRPIEQATHSRKTRKAQVKMRSGTCNSLELD